MANQLSDLNKGVMAKIMNHPLSTPPPVTPAAPVAPAPVAPAPVPLETPPPSDRVAPVPQTIDFPDLPADTAKPQPQQATPDPLPAPGTAQPTSDKDLNFAKLRTKLEATSAELVEMKARYFAEDGKTLKPEFSQSKEEIQTLKQELQQTQDKLARYNLMDDPRFAKKYQAKLGKVENEAKRILKDFGADDALLGELTRLSPKQRHDLLMSKAPETQYMLEPLLIQHDQIRQEQGAELDDWKNTMSRLQTEQVTETEVKVRAIKEALHSSVVRDLEDEGHPILKQVPGNEAWNRAVSSLKQQMRETLEVNDPKQQTKLLHQGIIAPVYYSMMLKATARANDLQRQLEILGGVRPGVDSRGSGSPDPVGQKAIEKATPMDAAKANKERFFGRS